jgi:hypothetical protein
MNKTLGIIIVLLVILGGAFYLSNNTVEKSDSNKSGKMKSTEGRVVFSVTDAAADMGAVSKITLKISKVEVHSAADGWVTVSTTPRTYSLLELNARNEFELLADVNVKANTYDQARLTTDGVSIQTTDGATHTAKLPSGVLKINTELAVRAGETSSMSFDFIANKSLHITGNGQYIFAPVIKAETKSNTNVEVNTNGIVEISGGRTDEVSNVGMDIDGSVKADFQIKAAEKLEIGTDNVIKLKLK